jgi:hypothetical protein
MYSFSRAIRAVSPHISRAFSSIAVKDATTLSVHIDGGAHRLQKPLDIELNPPLPSPFNDTTFGRSLEQRRLDYTRHIEALCARGPQPVGKSPANATGRG